MFFRFVTSGEIRKRSEFFEPFVMGLSEGTVEQFCKSSVEPMGEESDHVHITALSDALGVAIRVVYLDRSSCDSGGELTVNHHDFVPTLSSPPHTPFITLLYRPGHYDILYHHWRSCLFLDYVLFYMGHSPTHKVYKARDLSQIPFMCFFFILVYKWYTCFCQQLTMKIRIFEGNNISLHKHRRVKRLIKKWPTINRLQINESSWFSQWG